MGAKYQEFHRRSIEDRDGFWSEQARLVDWHKPFGKVLDYAKPPFATQRSRPLCEWPQWPRFKGGDANMASSFECAP